MFVRRRFWCSLSLATIWACSPSTGPGAAAPDRARTTRVAVPTPPPATIHLPSGSVGPFLMPAPNGWVAAWASTLGEDLHWHTATFDQSGAPSAAPRRLMEAPVGLATLRLRAVNPQRGMVVAAFESEDSDPEAPSYGLSTLVVSSAGTMLAGNATLVEECDPIVWIEVVPLENGALVAWAEDLGDHAELFAASVNLDGHRQTDVLTLHENARAWQLARHDKGAMLGVVTSDSNVEFVALDAKGAPGKPKILLDNHSAEADIDLVATGDRVLVAFSDRRGLETALYSAWVSLDGGLHSDPRPVTRPYGASTLIGLRSTPNGPVLLWQNTAQEPGVVRLGRVDSEGRLAGESLALELPPRPRAAAAADLVVPQVETTATGVVVMQPPCDASTDCKGYADALELGPELSPRTRLTWSERADADLVWDFQCGSVNCAALAANFGNRTNIAVLTTAAAERAPINSHANTRRPAPQATVQALIASEELAALDAARLGAGTLITTLTAFDPNTPYEIPSTPAPDGRMAPVQAQLKALWYGPKAETSPTKDGAATETSISIRARSVAGLEVAPAGNEALLVWTAIDDNKPQVFLTTLDKTGQKLRQSMLTRQNGTQGGEILALGAATAADASYYVAWIREEPQGNRVYVSHVNGKLIRQSPDVAVAESKGTFSDVALAVTRSGVLVVLAENVDGTESLKWLQLNPVNLQNMQGKVPVANPFLAAKDTAQFAPRFAPWKDGWVLAWLEQSNEHAALRVATLDSKAGVLSSWSAELPGEPTALSLDCDTACELAVAGEFGEEQRGYLALATVPQNPPEGFQLGAEVVVQSLSPVGAQLRPAVSGEGTYYFDVAPNAGLGFVREVRRSAQR